MGTLFRSYPLSGVIEAEAGYGWLLWGAPRSPFSGFVRPRLNGSTAGIYNSLDAALEIFPLAIFGARAGGEAMQNDRKYSAYDCDAHGCVGRQYRTYFEAEMTLGAGAVFLRGKWRRERWSQADPAAGDFIDPTSGLLMEGAGDWQTVSHGALGLRLSPAWTLMALLRYAQSAPRHFSRSPIGLIRYTDGRFSVGVGAGTFESSLKRLELTTQAFLRWEFAPGLAL